MSQNFGFERKKRGASALASFGNWQKEFYAQVGLSLQLVNVSIAWSAFRNHNCNNFISLKDLGLKRKIKLRSKVIIIDPFTTVKGHNSRKHDRLIFVFSPP